MMLRNPTETAPAITIQRHSDDQNKFALDLSPSSLS